MLACAESVHSFVCLGLRSVSLASRIDDCTRRPSSVRRGSRVAKWSLQALLDEALRIAKHQPTSVVLVNRACLICHEDWRDIDYAQALRPSG